MRGFSLARFVALLIKEWTQVRRDPITLRFIIALPIMHSGRAIGILYGDNAEHRAPIDSVTGLEIFLSQAGYAFGNAVFASEKARR